MMNMYFVFKPVLQVWSNSIVQAKIEDPPPKPQPHWWNCVPLTSPLPSITFTIAQNPPLLDNLFTGTVFDLYSSNLVSVLSTAGIRFETFPARVIDYSSREAIKTEYKIFHLLEKYPCLDDKLSKIDDDLGEIKKLVLRKECLQKNKQLFRLEGMEEIVLIHQELRNLIELNDIKGCQFIPVDEYQTGLDFYFDRFGINNGR